MATGSNGPKADKLCQGMQGPLFYQAALICFHKAPRPFTQDHLRYSGAHHGAKIHDL